MTRTELGLLAKCTRCKLAVKGEPPPFPAGSGVAKLCLVSARATREDLLYGAVGQSPAFKQIQSVLSDAGWYPHELYLTAAVKCAPAWPKDPAATAECKKKCVQSWLGQEISALSNATPIVLLGKEVADAAKSCDLLARPVYRYHSEERFLVGGKALYSAAVEFFSRLKSVHFPRVSHE